MLHNYSNSTLFTHSGNVTPEEDESGQNCGTHSRIVDVANRDSGSEGKSQQSHLHIRIIRCPRKVVQGWIIIK
jgi:hypothetical protein